MIQRTAAAWFLLVCLRADAAVVINEVFYDAPEDLEDLQYLELHNSGGEPVDLSGWKFTRGVRYQFPPGARIEGKGFLVLCRNPERFRESYRFAASGAFEKALNRTGEEIE